MDYFLQNEIYRQLTVQYSLQQNGIAEKKNKIIVEIARNKLKGKGLPNKFWEEVVYTSAYLMNRSPTKAVRNKSPYEAWHKMKLVVNNLKVFGCVAYALTPSQGREKFDAKGEKLIFIGYSDESKDIVCLIQTLTSWFFQEMLFFMNLQFGSGKESLLWQTFQFTKKKKKTLVQNATGTVEANSSRTTA